MRHPICAALMALAGSHVYVAWDDGLGEIPRVLLRRSADGGKSFSPEELLSDPDVAASYPVLALYGDSVAVAWTQTTAAEHREKLAAAVNMKDSTLPAASKRPISKPPWLHTPMNW